MNVISNQIKQWIVLIILIGLIIVVIRELWIFFPGFLAAITLYIISRGSYFQLVYHYKWKKSLSAALFLVGYTALLTLLVYSIIILLEPKVEKYLHDPSLFINEAKVAINDFQARTGFSIFTEDTAADLVKRISNFFPTLINSTFDMLANLALMLFLLYFMLYSGKEMEQWFTHMVPLDPGSMNLLVSETKRLVRASAVGIPLISIIQGITATLGYYLFGVEEYLLWGLLTGVFAFFPFIGTLIIWVPIVISMYAGGDTWNATGLLVYSLVVTGNIDYVARITILNKLGQVHPVVTVLGVIVGLNLFGFIGFIFGPLLLSYIMLLFRIYTSQSMLKSPH